LSPLGGVTALSMTDIGARASAPRIGLERGDRRLEALVGATDAREHGGEVLAIDQQRREPIVGPDRSREKRSGRQRNREAQGLNQHDGHPSVPSDPICVKPRFIFQSAFICGLKWPPKS
jgi:hypothetical protein